jgi:hypothetical protein
MHIWRSKRLPDISKEYAMVNIVLLVIMVSILVMPLVIILVQRFGNFPLTSYMPNCFVETHTGRHCSTCGLTRSIILLYMGRFHESVVQYSYGYLFVIIIAIQLLLRVVPYLYSQAWISYFDISQMTICGLLWCFISHSS